MPCNCCQVTDNTFGKDEAAAGLKDYRRRGPAKQTKLILDAIRSLNLHGATLLDIGGGVGSIYHELLGESVKEAIHVDASTAYLDVARQETERRGNMGRVQFIHADFTDVAADLPQVDVVTLDRVVCCYPNFHELLKAASSRGKSALVMTYPRESIFLAFGLLLMNFFQRLRRNPFRVFMHSVSQMDSVLNEQGFQRTSRRKLLVWEMSLFQRV